MMHKSDQQIVDRGIWINMHHGLWFDLNLGDKVQAMWEMIRQLENHKGKKDRYKRGHVSCED